MTKQEYRDLLVNTSSEGGFPAVGENGHCQYRTPGPDGSVRRCAVGLLIPDALYSPAFEGGTLTEAGGTRLDDAVDLPDGVTRWQLRRVQMVHDNLSSPGPDGWPHAEFVTNVDAVLADPKESP